MHFEVSTVLDKHMFPRQKTTNYECFIWSSSKFCLKISVSGWYDVNYLVADWRATSADFKALSYCLRSFNIVDIL